MTDSKALIERLRWGAWYFDDPFDGKAYASEDPLEAADHIEKLEADKALLREALEEFVASTGVSDDPDVLLVDALVYENAMRVLGLQK